MANGEQQPGGFVIVRAPSSQPLPRAQSTLPASTSSSQPPPPKKFRAGSTADVMADETNRLGRNVPGPSSQPTALPSHLQRTLPLNTVAAESPRIRHNRDMRSGSQAPSTPKHPGANGHRRRSSSSSRRKRTSDLFEETGVLSAFFYSSSFSVLTFLP